MAHHVLQYLEQSAARVPDKEAYEDELEVMTFLQMQQEARKTGVVLRDEIHATRRPVAVFMDKCVKSLVGFFGVLYSGNFYCPLDSHMPVERIITILNVLNPVAILTDEAHREQALSFAGAAKVILIEEKEKVSKKEAQALCEWETLTEHDPLYVLFTSGSTGVPKGVLLNHRVIINYLEWLDETFEFDENDVFGNQAPLYFDVSMHDVYGTMYFGAKMVIIPSGKFSFPIKLIEYLNEKRISTFLWVPSAMGIVANLKTFDALKPQYLKHAMFAGEVFPRKQLDYWTRELPDVVYANLYGPTETFVCTAYIRTGKEPEGEPLSIGTPISNVRALVLDEEGHEVKEGETGELCMAGSCLALGYYNNPQKTQESFTQSPLQSQYPERIYHTGDLVRYEEDGNLTYVSRKDFQIKHMGYRIELGEIENAANLIDEIRDCACHYDSFRRKIVLYYDGMELEKKVLLEKLAQRIPEYMLPGKIRYMEQLPHNANGKIDRKALKEL
ncbi:MAG: amino acid adenylation domain-containing protein [Wujia sp.]